MEPRNRMEQPAWPTNPAKRVASLTGHAGNHAPLAFTTDRCLLAAGGRDGAARVWDVAGTPGVRVTFGGGVDRFRSLAFSPTSRQLVAGSGGLDGTIRVYDVSDDDPHEVAVLRGARGPIEAVAFSPDGKQVAAAGDDRTLRAWEPIAGSRCEPWAQLLGHTATVRALAFAPDGQGVATASRDGTVRLWAMSRIRSREWAILPHPGEVTCVAFSPDGKTLASAAQDGVIRLWDPTALKPTARAELHAQSGSIRHLLITSDSRLLVSVGEGPRVMNWDLNTGRPVCEWEVPAGTLTGAAVTQDGRYMAAAKSDGTVDVYRIAEKRS